MIELSVQAYLRNGGTIEGLKEDLGIKSSEDENCVLLTYSQIDSPKSNPIVMECRGIILEKDTWNIVYMPFHRFFNYGEMPALVEQFGPQFYPTAMALEKLDGSMLGLWNYRGEWHISTRGSIDAKGQVGMCPITFRQLADMTIDNYPDFWANVNPSYTYTFELCTPENRVVTPYTSRELYLLTARDKDDNWRELSRDDLMVAGLRTGVPLPKVFPFTDIEGLVRLAADQPKLSEGFVCVSYDTRYNDMSYGRVKVKNPAYLAIAHLKDSSANSLRGLMMLVMQGETDEFLAYFPEFTDHISRLSAVYEEFVSTMEEDWHNLRFLAALPKTTENRKEFALAAKETRLPSMMFSIYTGKGGTTVRDTIIKMIARDGAKRAAKNMMEWCKCKDIEWATSEG